MTLDKSWLNDDYVLVGRSSTVPTASGDLPGSMFEDRPSRSRPLFLLSASSDCGLRQTLPGAGRQIAIVAHKTATQEMYSSADDLVCFRTRQSGHKLPL